MLVRVYLEFVLLFARCLKEILSPECVAPGRPFAFTVILNCYPSRVQSNPRRM